MRRQVMVAAVVVGLASTACGAGRIDVGGHGPVKVVAGFYPLFEVAERVGGDRVTVSNLTPAGAEPHDLEITSRHLDRIEDAALVVYIGGGFQPAFEHVLARAHGALVDALGVEEHDPHVWLDPSELKRITGEVAAALARIDPAGQAVYAANAAAYGQELDGLDGEFRDGLAHCDRHLIVTSHAAFGHLAARYGLVQRAITGLSPESEPDPKRVAELAREVRATGTTTVFSEELVSPKVAQALAREAGVTTEVLNPLEGLSAEDRRAGRTYVSVMRDNLAALRSALGCR